MYIKRSEASVPNDRLDALKQDEGRVHEFLRTMPGFRWAMLLSSLDTPGRVAAVSMWLSPEQASAQDGNTLGDTAETRGYDVATARGSMTPASHIAVVDWHVPDDVVERFTNRWNAAYHAIEDRIGSRLLKDLEAPSAYVGLHAVTDEANLQPDGLNAAIKDPDGLSLTPSAVYRYEVVLLTEA